MASLWGCFRAWYMWDLGAVSGCGQCRSLDRFVGLFLVCCRDLWSLFFFFNEEALF